MDAAGEEGERGGKNEQAAGATKMGTAVHGSYFQVQATHTKKKTFPRAKAAKSSSNCAINTGHERLFPAPIQQFDLNRYSLSLPPSIGKSVVITIKCSSHHCWA